VGSITEAHAATTVVDTITEARAATTELDTITAVRAATTVVDTTVVVHAATTVVDTITEARAATTELDTITAVRAVMIVVGSSAGHMARIDPIAPLTTTAPNMAIGPSEAMSARQRAICARKSAAQGVSGSNVPARSGAIRNNARHRGAGARSVLASAGARPGVRAFPSARGLAAMMRIRVRR